MKNFSLRSRLIIYFSLISALIFSGAGLMSWLESKETIDEFFDTYQMALARQMAVSDWNSITPELQKRTNAIIKNIQGADDDDEAVGFAVFDRNGKIVFHDNEHGKNFYFQESTGKFLNQDINGEKWRIVWVVSVDRQYIIAVGQELEYRDDMVWDMLEEFLGPWLLGLVILLFAIIFIITKEFLPLNRLAQKVEKRQSGDLSPLSEDGIPHEVLPLIEAVNLLLRQIEDMLARERRFIADSAHELRTPLTALKVQTEVALMNFDNLPALEKNLKNLMSGIDRSTRLVEQLLALSKTETVLNQEQTCGEKLDWTEMANSLIEEYMSAAEEKNIAIINNISEDAPFIKGNPVFATLLLRNLIDNAIKYSGKDAAVTLYSDKQELVVSNNHVSISKEHLEKLGQRFYRPSGQDETGSGLGLSIVSGIAKFYGCRVDFNYENNIFTVRIHK